MRGTNMGMGSSVPSSRAQGLAIGCWLWAVLGGSVALIGLTKVNSDARLLVGVLSVVLPAFAVGAGFLVRRGHSILAVVALLLSAGTPTYFIYIVNLSPIGLAVAICFYALREGRPAQVRS